MSRTLALPWEDFLLKVNTLKAALVTLDLKEYHHQGAEFYQRGSVFPLLFRVSLFFNMTMSGKKMPDEYYQLLPLN